MDPEIKDGRIGDLLKRRSRSDWSAVNARIKTLEPGAVVNVTAPDGVPVAQMRSAILTSGRRYHAGAWALSSRTAGRTVSFFLAPRE